MGQAGSEGEGEGDEGDELDATGFTTSLSNAYLAVSPHTQKLGKGAEAYLPLQSQIPLFIRLWRSLVLADRAR